MKRDTILLLAVTFLTLGCVVLLMLLVGPERLAAVLLGLGAGGVVTLALAGLADGRL